jgi:fibronectin type 3 domain-containing protein
VPATILDLKATQDKSNVVLTWTNPARYSDGSTATDLAKVHILQDGNIIQSIPSSGPGKQQSHSLPIIGAFGTTPIYTVELETQRGKRSAASNEIGITLVEVPGVVSNLQGHMDQHRIWLYWEPPVSNPSLAEIYLVRRVDGAFPPVSVTETHFEDTNIEAGKTFSYIVTAARSGATQVSGPPSAPYSLLAKDEVAPKVPSGLQPPLVSDSVAFLRWDSNSEEDFAGYKVYRSDRPDTAGVLLEIMPTTASFRDSGYRPNSYYRITAFDEAGNESDKSAPVHTE